MDGEKTFLRATSTNRRKQEVNAVYPGTTFLYLTTGRQAFYGDGCQSWIRQRIYEGKSSVGRGPGPDCP